MIIAAIVLVFIGGLMMGAGLAFPRGWREGVEWAKQMRLLSE